jgi:hydroxyacylglutathione hydrolase
LNVSLTLQKLKVGPWPMNSYLITCSDSGQVAIVDPGADAGLILEAVGDLTVHSILLTHGHPDHVGALDEVCRVTGAPVGIHPADGDAFGIDSDFPLLDGMQVEFGKQFLQVAYVPGHTQGSVCLKLNGQAIVGDAIFPGGPGYTASPEDLAQSVVTLGGAVFAWPDDTELFPGHGESTTVGAERADFERFLEADHPPGLCGHVSWR